MSKSALKKELRGFTAEQLLDIILQAYDSSKETKAYFEFFLSPDPEAFVKEKFEQIGKELRRVKHGMSKGRISVVRAAIKQGIDYGIGRDYISRLYAGAISLLLSGEKYLYFSDALFKGTYRLVCDYLIWANKNEMLSVALIELNQLTSDSERGTSYFRSNISERIQETLSTLSITAK